MDNWKLFKTIFHFQFSTFNLSKPTRIYKVRHSLTDDCDLPNKWGKPRKENTMSEENINYKKLTPKYLIEAEKFFPPDWSYDKNRQFREITSDYV